MPRKLSCFDPGQGSLQSSFGTHPIYFFCCLLRLREPLFSSFFCAKSPININIITEFRTFDEKGNSIVGNLRKAATYHKILGLLVLLITERSCFDCAQEWSMIRENTKLTANTRCGDDIDILTDNSSSRCDNFKMYLRHRFYLASAFVIRL